MKFHRLIRTIYWKELLDILRDRRTLVAMIVVPIVLYPLLMVGSVQAVGVQTEGLSSEIFKIGTVGETQGRLLQQLVQRDDAVLSRMAELEEKEGEQGKKKVKLMDALIGGMSQSLAGRLEIFQFENRDALEAAVRNRAIQAGVIFDSDELISDPNQQNAVTFIVDQENLRGKYVESLLHSLLNRTGARMVWARLQQRGLPKYLDQPFTIDTVDLSSPPSILGQILPLILILMTITGAIYPAIDLTAGERERGTLESLMVTPVPTFDLIAGKFLVVTTVAIFGATLNLASVAATVHFGGFDIMVSESGGVPLATMGVVLLSLIPFAVLMSAIMIAVCSYARTFKEAQNYVTPVILAVLIPGGLAAMPTTRMEGVMLVMPVGNMVLLSRELLLGTSIPVWQIILVLLSTTLYAVAAVAVAAGIFGRESVVFADGTTMKASLSRAMIRPKAMPPVSTSLMIVALLYPVWFFVQSSISSRSGGNVAQVLFVTAWAMPLLFIIVPAMILWYCRINLANAFFLRMPRGWHLLAGVLIGASAWVPAHELTVLQMRLFALPAGIEHYVEAFGQALQELPPVSAVVLIALVPAICEESLFRGLLMSGLSSGARKWTAILVSAAVFGVFHYVAFKFVVTAAIGIVLGYLCWQSRSILPGIIAHGLHNAVSIMPVLDPRWPTWLGITDSTTDTESTALSDATLTHLPVHVLVIGFAVLVAGLMLASMQPRGTGDSNNPPGATEVAGARPR
ncbi:MAG: CPBP family intramembrane metalloprotease [Phycisphaerae bacterium]|nr:CPBP family intramembrane metalloprotease [Phycisphaerae bacterium]